MKTLKRQMRDNGFLQIKLKKEVAEGEKGIEESPHPTAVVGEGVEKYTLEVLYEPDYTTPPEGQGGTPENAKEYKTGGYGTAYQGHAAGKEDRNNTHKINVYAKPLDVLKLDNSNKTLAGAKFALYRAAKEFETPVESDLAKYDKSLSGDYFKISEGTSGSDGIVHLANTGNDGRTRLAVGENYYLIETEVPEGYERESAFKVVTVETDENGTYTDLKKQDLEENVYPFNWDQGARIVVDDSVVPLDGTGNEVSMAGKQYLRDDEVAVFRTKVFNTLTTISIEVEKKWTDVNDNPLEDHPDTIEFKLYRVSHKTCNHNWTVTPAECEKAGSRKCSICGKEETIPETGHAWGEWEIVRQAEYNRPGLKRRVCANDPSHVQEEEYTIEGHTHVYGDWAVTTPATCEGEGVMTRYCTICLEPDPNTQTIPELGHDYKMTSQTPATCTENGSRTFTCSHDSRHSYTETIPATGHDYGDWVVTTPATTKVPGVETRYCSHDPSHTETREIPQLDDATTVTFNINKHIGNAGEYYEYDYKTVAVTYPIGTRIRLEWTYPNGYFAPEAWFKKNNTREHLNDYGQKGRYLLIGARMPYVEIVKPGTPGSVSTYSFEVDVSENLLIDICLENSWDKELPTPTITVVSEAPKSAGARSTKASVPKRNAALMKSAVMSASSSQKAAAEMLTSEQLKALMDAYLTPEQAEGKYDVDVIEEITPAYTVNAEDGWKKTVENLPRRDDEGNEYTYYVVETSPATGYITTYSGESSGVKDGGKVTITNKRVEVTIEILKRIAGTSTPLPGAAFTLTQVDENGNNISGGVVKGPVETDSTGKISLDKVVPGRYKLEETAPAGYIITEGPYYINVTADGSDNVEGAVVYAEADGHVFTIQNEPGAALPHTGGPGTNRIYLFGTLLTALAGAVLLLKRQRRTAA